MSEPVSILVPGTTFHGRYDVVRRIGAGGMGAVYEVMHRETRRRCALKTLLPELVAEPDARARFQLEATVTADIRSEHLVQLFDAGVDAETSMPFLVMELLRGEDLAATLDRRGVLGPAEAVAMLGQVAVALDKTHALGIVHRDLKPENLFVTARDDGAPLLKILDFGVAKVVADSARKGKTTKALGTPLYMAPEQVESWLGQLGPATDLYALGHIAYAMLVGRSYWEEEAEKAPTVFALLAQVCKGARDSASAMAQRTAAIVLPTAFDVWFARGTAREPSTRFASAAAMVLSLAEALDVEPPVSLLRASAAGVADTIPPPSPPRLTRSTPGDAETQDTGTAASARRTTAAVSTERATTFGRRKRAHRLVPLVAIAGMVVSAGVLWRLVKPSPDSMAAPSAAPVESFESPGPPAPPLPVPSQPAPTAPDAPEVVAASPKNVASASRPAPRPPPPLSAKSPGGPPSASGSPRASADPGPTPPAAAFPSSMPAAPPAASTPPRRDFGI